MAALRSAAADPHTDQIQAAPKIQAGAMKDTCSESDLLTAPKGLGHSGLFGIFTIRTGRVVPVPRYEMETWG